MLKRNENQAAKRKSKVDTQNPAEMAEAIELLKSVETGLPTTAITDDDLAELIREVQGSTEKDLKLIGAETGEQLDTSSGMASPLDRQKSDLEITTVKFQEALGCDETAAKELARRFIPESEATKFETKDSSVSLAPRFREDKPVVGPRDAFQRANYFVSSVYFRDEQHTPSKLLEDLVRTMSTAETPASGRRGFSLSYSKPILGGFEHHDGGSYTEPCGSEEKHLDQDARHLFNSKFSHNFTPTFFPSITEISEDQVVSPALKALVTEVGREGIGVKLRSWPSSPFSARDRVVYYWGAQEKSPTLKTTFLETLIVTCSRLRQVFSKAEDDRFQSGLIFYPLEEKP